MDHPARAHSVDTLVIGGGQAGLSVGYHLARRGVPFLILEARARIGDAWRERWDSLRLFSPARYDGLDGMPFPAPAWTFPTKDEMADYLERYAERFALPVRTGVRVERLTRENGRFRVETTDGRFDARAVVVAMSDYQRPRRPDFAAALDDDIRQLHSADYRSPAQLRDGPVLIVGAGNSGAEIALELSDRHPVWLSGRDTGALPFRIEGAAARRGLVRLTLRGLFHRVLSVRTPIGRALRRRILHRGGPLIRTRPSDLQAVGIERVTRTAGVQEGQPVLEDGRVLPATNVLWCTGFEAGFDWIDLPVHGPLEPRHASGRALDVPDLWFVGLFFQHALSSAMVHGVGRDAARAAAAIAEGYAKTTSPASTTTRSSIVTVGA